VRTRLRLSENGQGPAAEIQIEDDGGGIDAGDLATIFDPFFTTKSLGTGLGLTNARKVVELHRGEISVASEPGVGTTVTIAIPYRQAPAETDEAEKDSQAQIHEVHSGH
jgi:signal transduction histidine kinase